MFLIEQRLDLVATTEPVFLVRERGTGIRSWIKCSDGSEESTQRLRNEAFILPRIAHPHILSYHADRSGDHVPFLMYPWQADVPLVELEIAAISGPDRARLALALTEVIVHLQSLDSPVAHGRILPENLWLTPTIQWLRLTGFSHATLEAPWTLLQEDRSSTVRILGSLLPPGELLRIGDESISELTEAWQEGEETAAVRLCNALSRLFLTYVTEDL